MAKLLIFLGLLITLAGFIGLYFPKIFSWFGHLPGDIHFDNKNSHIFIPLGSMIIISIILTLVFNLAGWAISIFSKMK